MVSVHGLVQATAVDMRINLSGRDIGMPQHLLNGPQVGTALKQVGGKSMPELMG